MAGILLEKDQEKEIIIDFTMNEAMDMNSVMVISMGTIEGEDTPASTIIEMSDFSLIRTE